MITLQNNITMSEPIVGYIYDAYMTKHQTYNHPECPERIITILSVLKEEKLLHKMVKMDAREATFEELCFAHTQEYVNMAEQKLNGKKGIRKQFTNKFEDVYANEHTLKCAKLAAGSTIDLSLAVAQNRLNSGVAIVRPPGHHAMASSTGGFCIFNNVAIAAKILKKYLSKILIVDFDIHRGDGTQNIVENDEGILFFSVHRYDCGDFYPQNALSNASNIINANLNGSIGDSEYLSAFKTQLLPVATKFKPDIILVSAGFDGAVGDPLGKSNITSFGYRQMMNILKTINTKIVVVLEGGYHLTNTAHGMAECVGALLEIKK